MLSILYFIPTVKKEESKHPKKRFLTRKERTQNIINNSKLINNFLKSAIQRSNEEPEIIKNSKMARVKKMPAVNYILEMGNMYEDCVIIFSILYCISLC
jgi:hypothetical protein